MEKVRALGQGSYGSVDLVRLKQTDGTFKLYALKSSKSWAYSNLAKELKILSDLQGCSGVIQCISESVMEKIDSNGEKMYSVLLEYANGGTLETLMKNYKDEILPDYKIRQFAKMILGGLQSIHEKGYIHCDLTPKNILVFNRLVEEDGVYNSIDEVKIADFGLTIERKKRWQDCWSPSSPFIGTPFYMSPESVKSGRIGSYLDIWSFGCIILEMYTRKSPWPGKTVEEIRVALTNEITPEIPEHLPIVAKRFLDMCFVLNPTKRITASELLNHQLFQEILDEPNMCMGVMNGREEEQSLVEYKERDVKIKFIGPKKPSPTKNKVTSKFMCKRAKQESPAKNIAAKFRNIRPRPKIRKPRIIPPKQLV